jgi:hypothetical protein
MILRSCVMNIIIAITGAAITPLMTAAINSARRQVEMDEVQRQPRQHCRSRREVEFQGFPCFHLEPNTPAHGFPSRVNRSPAKTGTARRPVPIIPSENKM